MDILILINVVPNLQKIKIVVKNVVKNILKIQDAALIFFKRNYNIHNNILIVVVILYIKVIHNVIVIKFYKTKMNILHKK